jgi:hypothetical protein
MTSLFKKLFGRQAAPAPPPPARPMIPGAILVDGKTYCPFALMIAPPDGGAQWTFPGGVEDRSRFGPPEAHIDLKTTYGAYLSVGGRNVLIIVDKAATGPGSKRWLLIHAAAKVLESAYPALNAQARDALSNLNAVIFASSPKRSFASVAGGWFFYDVDEFVSQGEILVSPAYVASNMVHDANHVRQYHAHQPHTGDKAEIDGWRLQVDNGPALGLQPYEIDYLKDFIAHPEKATQRMNENP